MIDDALVLPLDDAAADIATVGGKGASLARLVRAGLPVPPGFHVTTRAYRDFVATDGLDQQIQAALPDVDLDDPAAVEQASATIAAAFARRPLPPATAEAILFAYRAMTAPNLAVAVRSSATAEDLPGMSFAGQQDTFLNITGPDALLDAVRRCWASLWTARAIGYRARHGIAPQDVALAVVVQQLVPADAAGVLFTANPLTGARDELMINAAWGLGEAVVGGQVTPDTYVLAHGSGTALSRQVNDKTVMTVRTADGTREEPVPQAQRREPVLDQAAAAELAGLGERIQDLYDMPMDIEWTVHNGQLAIVQARPITNLREPQPPAEVWNDSLRGDYLWTCANLGEAVPSVMTPVTWSVAQALSLPVIAGHPMHGNIGGRFYLNLSVPMALGSAVGQGRRVRRGFAQVFGRIPEEVQIPLLPMSGPAVLGSALRAAGPILRQEQGYRKRMAATVAESPARCAALQQRIREATDPGQLAALWRSDLDTLLRVTARTLDAGARKGGPGKLQRALSALVGEGDANTLLTGLQTASTDLASLGPVLGLARLRRGELDRETYASTWGHRCADEFEISAPRPAEDTAWIDRQLQGLTDGGPEELLERQAKAREEAWQRLLQQHPRRAAKLRRRLDRAAEAARARERARSEFARTFWVFRAFVLRAAELTGNDRGTPNDLFFLRVEEILAVLDGDPTALAAVPARRAGYEQCRALPPYPTLIRGHFDPVAWAADPDRRSDVYDEQAALQPVGAAIAGFAGVGGVVEGNARVIATVEEGDTLQQGEILVTTVTNIGWTPLFPRAAAVVTDIGAPLSHAAIVARELGIPAVVGCGNATVRLATGDRIRVDGGQGTVTVLASASSRQPA